MWFFLNCIVSRQILPPADILSFVHFARNVAILFRLPRTTDNIRIPIKKPFSHSDGCCPWVKTFKNQAIVYYYSMFDSKVGCISIILKAVTYHYTVLWIPIKKSAILKKIYTIFFSSFLKTQLILLGIWQLFSKENMYLLTHIFHFQS